MTFGSLFAGIGGFDLGFERAGMACKWQVEIDDYANRVLAKHWPNVRRHRDVRTFPPEPPSDWTVDVVCGGFPCQDISVAGNGAGIEGERSGLWREYVRVIRVLRPRFVVVENVAALLGRGLGTVLGDLAWLGFDAEWNVLPACAMGAPHARERVFIVAHAHEIGWSWARSGLDDQHDLSSRQSHWEASPPSPEWGDVQRWLGATFQNGDWESSETKIHRMDDGIPAWVDRNGLYGNAVVPQVAEWIGRRLMEISL